MTGKITSMGSPTVSDTITMISAAPTVQFSPLTYSVSENGGVVNLQVTLSAAIATPVNVNYTTSDGTAKQPDDYVASSGTLTFVPGETNKTFSVPIVNDNLPEANEVFNVTLSNVAGGGATLAHPGDQAVVTIIDDDPAPSLQFSSATYTTIEGSVVNMVVRLSQVSGSPVTVNYATSDGTAKAPADYTASSGTLTFAPGDTSKTLSVATVDDTLSEPNETFTLALSNLVNATMGTPSVATVTIIDNDPTCYTLTTSANPSAGGTVSSTPVSNCAGNKYTQGTLVSLSATATAGYGFSQWSGAASGNANPLSVTMDGNKNITANFTLANTRPVANNQNVSTAQNTPINIILTASDAEADPLTYNVVNNPVHGTLNGTAPNLVYTPAAGFSGSDSFTFKANDGKVDSNIATINITVSAPPITFSIAGRVIDTNNNPIPDVTVSTGTGNTTATDANGNFTLSGLAAGTYTLIFTKPGYTFSPALQPITVPPDAYDINFTGAQSQTATLFVVSAQGNGSTNQIFRYKVGPADNPSLDLTIADPSFNNPFGLAFSDTGELFVTNRGSPSGGSGQGSISRFLNPQGSPSPHGVITSNLFNRPHGVIFRNGELFTAQAAGTNVLRFTFDSAGNASSNGTITAGLCCSTPRGITVNPTTGELFVTECCGVSEINRYLLDANGNVVPNGTITGGGLSNPHDMVFSSWGELFVANAGNNSVSRFIFDAAHNASPNGQLTGNGLNGPVGLDFSPWGELFVANQFAASVSRWTFNASHNASPNGLFSTPATLGDLQFYPASVLLTYNITGKVTDVNDNPISAVTISADAGHTTSTDTNGNYTLPGLAAGTYTLTPNKSGYTFSPASSLVSVPVSGTKYNFKGYDKPPIVFVHGWAGLGNPWDSCDWPTPEDYFEKVDDDLHAAGYYVAYAHLETSPCYTPPLLENVTHLQNAITLAKAATHQPKVILIAHSMGGLVSRAYVERAGYDNDVSALFTFGSPHLGVPSDVLTFFTNGISLGIYCDKYQPGACDFSTAGMLLFNQNHKKREGVDYHIISGNAPFFSRNAFGKIMDGIIIGPDDGIVPTISGIGLDGIIDRGVTDEVHSTRFGPHTYFIRDGGQSESYMLCLKKVLIDKSTSCGPTEVHAAAQDTPELSTRTPFGYGHLLPGQTVTRIISLEGGPTLFAAQWQTGTVAITLIDPTGQVIDPAYATNNPNIVTYSADTTLATYYFANASAGTWRLVLQAASIPAEGNAYTTFAAFESSIVLTAGTDRAGYAPTETAIITAALTSSPLNAGVTVTILRADGVTDTIPLLSLGAGQYRGMYIVPNALGYTEIRLVANGNTTSGAPFERGRNLLFQISPNLVSTNNIYLPLISH